MNLPNYFLADLPAQASLSAQMIAEAGSALRQNRTRYLAERPTGSLIGALSEVAQGWLEAGNPFRVKALELGPEATGFSRETLEHGLNAFFAGLTADNLRALVAQDLGHPHRLERMTANDWEEQAERAALARGPELLAQVTAGQLPNPTLMGLTLGLLARSAQFVKCATGTSLIPRLFAHSIYEVEPKLGACLEIAEWKGGTRTLDQALFNQADCVVAMGSDETIASIRQQVPSETRFLGYGHRVSFGYVAQEVLGGMSPRKVVARAARDVIAWDQQGCLSPHVFYVETGGRISPERFAEMLAEELAACEQTQPRGTLAVEAAAAIAARRSFYEVRAAHSNDTKLWCSPGSTAWTVVYENAAEFHPSCLNRFIYVKAVADLTQALHGADVARGRVSTVGLAATENRACTLATHLARWGVTRVCPLGQMQNPPVTWRHDGRPSLGDLVTWTDWERSVS